MKKRPYIYLASFAAIFLFVWWGGGDPQTLTEEQPAREVVPPLASTPEAPLVQTEVQDDSVVSIPEAPLDGSTYPDPAPTDLSDLSPASPREALFEGASSVEFAAAVRADSGLVQRARVVRLPEEQFKHTWIRTEEWFAVSDAEISQDPRLENIDPSRAVQTVDMVADQLLVQRAEGMSDAAFREAMMGAGLPVERALRGEGSYLVQLPRRDVDAVPEAKARLRAMDSMVAAAHPNVILHTTETIPNDLDSALWGLRNTGQDGGTPGADISAPEAWSIHTGSSNVVVAVIDTGIDYRHPDLAANMWTNPDPEAPDEYGYDFFNNNPDPLDDGGHGTHVAGTIGAVGNNNLGIVGVNWDVSLMAIKFLSGRGSGTLADGVDAIYYAVDNGAHVINASWGAVGDPNDTSFPLYQAVEHALQSGVSFVAAAGNSGNDNAVDPVVPGAYPLHEEGLISVAAGNRNDGLAPFSNYGATTVDLAAPGVDIYSTYINNTYRNANGTSMAAPHVAGVAALVLAESAGLTPAQIRQLLMQSVDPADAFANTTRSGGRLNAVESMIRLIAPRVWVTDVQQSTSDDSAYPHPGETVTYEVTATNFGVHDTAESVQASAEVVSGQEHVQLTQDQLNFGTLSPGQSHTAAENLVLDIAPTTPTPWSYTVRVTLTDDDSNTWTHDIEGTVYTSTEISGTVTLDGSPAAGVTVEYRGLRSGSVTTDGSGAYVIPDLIDDTYEVWAAHSGWVETASRFIQVPPDAGEEDFAFTTVSVAGQVRDNTGTPLSDATVAYDGALSGSVSVDGSGMYLIERIFGQTETLNLTADVPNGFATEPRALNLHPPVNRTGEDFVFQQVTLAGTVVDANTSDPVENASLVFSGYHTGETQTNAFGEFSFELLAGRDGQIQVEAFKPDVYRPTILTLSVPPSHTDLQIELESGWYQAYIIPNPHSTRENKMLFPKQIYGINERGDVVATARWDYNPWEDADTAVVYRADEGYVVLHDQLDRNTSRAMGINDFSDVGGDWSNSSIGPSSQLFAYINDTLYEPGENLFVGAIDNNGRIYGISGSQALTFLPGEGVREFHDPGEGAGRVFVEDVNRHHQLLFRVPYPDFERVWGIGTLEELEAGEYTQIPTFGNTDSWYFWSVNNDGNAVGHRLVSGGREMYIYWSDTHTLELLPDPPSEWDFEFSSHRPWDFNNRATVVGTNALADNWQTGVPQPENAVPWIYRDGEFTDLRQLVPSTHPLHTRMYRPTSINDDGIIAGLAWNPDLEVAEMFLLVPPPETQPGRIQFVDPSPEVAEDAWSLTLTVERVNGIQGDVSIDFQTFDETAEAGFDYVAKSGTLHWSAGDDSDREIVITILDDDIPEGRETFRVELLNPTGDALPGFHATATVTIIDTDLPAGIVAHWPMDAAAGEVVADLTLNGNEGTFVGSPEWAPGFLDNGLLFSEGDGVQVGTHFYKPETGTVAMWVRREGGSGIRRIFDHQTDAFFADRIMLGIDGENRLIAGLGEGAHLFTGPSLGEDFVHVALTWDEGAFILYLNGESVGSGSYNPFDRLSSTAWLGRSATVTGESWVGMLDDGRVYDEALSAQEIANLAATEPNVPPVAAFSLTPESGDTPLEVSFDASASHDPDGMIILYEWDFLGNGTWTSGGVSAQYTYLYPGEYTPALRVTDDRGGQDVTTAELTVTGDPPPNQPPVAEFTATPNEGPFPLEVTFDASASSDPDGEIVSYDWDFTNNGSFNAFGITTSHTYTEPGLYTARLRVTDNDGATDETFVQITVTETSPDSVLIVDWGQTASTGEIRDGADPESTPADLSGNGEQDDLILTYPLSDTVPLSPQDSNYEDVPVYGGIRVDTLAEPDMHFAERTLADHFHLRPARPGEGPGGGLLISWGLSHDILEDSWTNIGNTSTSTPSGNINGTSGTFRYRSHTTAIVTNTNYDNPPESPDFGYAVAQWNSGGAPGMHLRVEGRDSNAPDGDFIQLNNTTGGSNYGAALVWWELDEPHHAGQVPVAVQSLAEGGTFALAVRNGSQWYLGEAGETVVDDLGDIQWTAYNPVDGTPQSLFANHTGSDTVGDLADLTFVNMTFDDITAMGLYSERIDTTQNREIKIRQFSVEAGTPAPFSNLHLALWWDQADFLNDGHLHVVSFQEDSFLRVRGLQSFGLDGEIRWLVRQGADYYLSEATLPSAADITTHSFTGPEDHGNWALWNPAQDLTFDAASANWQPMTFDDLTAIGLAVNQPLHTQEGPDIRFDRFEAAALLTPHTSQSPFEAWLELYAYDHVDPDTYEVSKGGQMVSLRKAFLLGDDPNDERDLPKVRMEGMDGLLFDTLPNRLYQVEMSTDLQDWTPLEVTIHRTTGVREEVHYTLPEPGDETRRFYRLRIAFP
ncbi:MAG: S8 family serine peptidase [Opitutales bacterium]|nr:S8 family serine peptidase [Opitutales bacterium]